MHTKNHFGSAIGNTLHTSAILLYIGVGLVSVANYLTDLITLLKVLCD